MASATARPLKGILKNTSDVLHGPSQHEPRESAARRAAVQHASILEARKQTEAKILDNIIELIDLPLNPPTDPTSSDPPLDPSNGTRSSTSTYASTHPSPIDTSLFLSLIRIFQPTDYDDLITERNICTEQRCGYVLCPNHRLKFSSSTTTQGGGASSPTYKLVNLGKKNFDIVERKELEKWCSPGCAKRAMWIKVQLNETAAWERWGDEGVKIDLYPEEQESTTVEGEKPSKTPAPARTDAVENAAALALERGDVPHTIALPRTMNLVIREKQSRSKAVPPSLNDGEDGGDIEGYKTTFGTAEESD